MVTLGQVCAVSTTLAVIIAIPSVAITFLKHYVIRAEFFLILFFYWNDNTLYRKWALAAKGHRKS
jgi:hypothetical protein